MNWGKIVSGVSLSIIFLAIMFFAVQGALSLSQNPNLLLAGFLAVSEPGQSAQFQEGAGAEKQPPYRNWDIPEFSFGAESGLVMDVSLSGTDKILFKKNSYTKLPIASLTKLMTAVVCLENYNPQQTGKFQEKEMPAVDLLYIMLIESNNDAALALSKIMGEKAFVGLMNQKAKELSMDNTFFEDPTGLSSKNVSTAEDLVKLSKYILLKHPEIARISRTKEYDMPGYGMLLNTDQLLGEIPGIIAGKTGFTIDAKGCLLLMLDNSQKDNYLVYVVLGAQDRFSEMKNMINWINQAYIWH